jgi:hypothetical protein
MGLNQAQQNYLGPAGPPINELLTNFQMAQAARSPQQVAIDKQNAAIRQYYMTAPQQGGGGFGQMPGGAFNPGPPGMTGLLGG